MQTTPPMKGAKPTSAPVPEAIPSLPNGKPSQDQSDNVTHHSPFERLQRYHSKLDKNYDELVAIINKIKSFEAEIDKTDSVAFKSASDHDAALLEYKKNSYRQKLENLIIHRDQLGTQRKSLHEKISNAEKEAENLKTGREKTKTCRKIRREKSLLNQLLGIGLNMKEETLPEEQGRKEPESDGESDLWVEIITH